MLRTRVGYTGGSTSGPTYRALGDHTEAIQIDYDPARIPYERLLEVFFGSHDPCSGSWSTQYRKALFHHGEEQERAARAMRARVARERGRPVLTELLPAGAFWRAEDYHQKYYLRRQDRLARSVRALCDSERAFVDSTAAARANGRAGGHLSDAELAAALRPLGLALAGSGADATLRAAGAPAR